MELVHQIVIFIMICYWQDVMLGRITFNSCRTCHVNFTVLDGLILSDRFPANEHLSSYHTSIFRLYDINQSEHRDLGKKCLSSKAADCSLQELMVNSIQDAARNMHWLQLCNGEIPQHSDMLMANLACIPCVIAI